MTEGGATRIKRNGARLFKNPPQPHMCIQDFIQGSTLPCYVNVLSWEKITMPLKPSLPVPFYGGMRVRPPRTNAEAIVFAVMTSPEYLQINGKNATNPEKRSYLIELLLDFVETVNTGMFFTRQYTILKDRDITGELKDIWNAVQARQDLDQLPPQQETWIDAQPPVPQYSQLQDHQQEYSSQPPQYHTSIAYGRAISNEGMHFESYGHQSQTPIIPQNDQMYQSGQIVSQQYHGNVPRITQDRYNDRDCGRENIVQNIPQQNCPAYPARECHLLLPRRMDTLYSSVDSYIHPNPSLNYGPPTNANINPIRNTNLATPFQPHFFYQERVDNVLNSEMRRACVQPVLQYESVSSLNIQTTPSINRDLQRLDRSHMAFVPKNNASKRQVNSPTHSKQSSCTNCQNKDTSDNSTKPKSPVKVLQRELPLNNRQDVNHHAFTDKVPTEKGSVEETKNVQVTDLDEEVKKNNDSDGDILDSSRKPNDTRILDSALTSIGRNVPNSVEDVPPSEEKLQETKHTDVLNGKHSSEQKYPKSKAIVMKGNKHKENTESNGTIRIRFVSDQKNDSPKRSQTTVNSIIKSVFKIHPGMSGEETSGKRKTNGQTKGNVKTNGENEEPQQGYTILKKSDSITQEEVMSELAQISIQDCKEAPSL
ncbi:uncharacterized protein LOC143145897 isoform X2 [Ptiloglossa arizonensis]